MSGPLVHHYAPHGACREVFFCEDAEVLVSGPAGTGKSRACLEKLNMMAAMFPGMRGLIIRKTATSLTSTALVTWKRDVVPELMQTGEVAWYGGSAQEAAQYRYANGSTITVGGMDKATRIMSSEYDLIYVQEATELTADDWEALTTRLRSGIMPYQQLMADANPNTPTHWLKTRCDDGRTTMLESRHEDNPTLFEGIEDHETAEEPCHHPDRKMNPAGEMYLEKLDALTGPRYQRLRRGLWVGAEGIIYEEFDPAIHLVDQFEVPESWTRYWAVDFGFRNPFVCQWWAEDPDGDLYLYREWYKSGLLVEQHGREMLKQVTRLDGTWKEPRPMAVVADHDVEGRATLERILGMSTTPAHKAVTEGIQAVQSRMQPSSVTGKPRLFLMRDVLVQRDEDLADARKPCSTPEEITGYIWAPTPDGKPQKEEPHKEDDHGCDAMRYLVAERDLGGRPNVRWM